MHTQSLSADTAARAHGPKRGRIQLRAPESHLWQRSLRVAGSTWTLGVLVAICSWSVDFLAPAAGLDPSWKAGLYMAAQHGMHFGTQIVFTYGPLGFLLFPGYWYEGLGALAFVYQSALHIALCISLVWALRRSVGAAIAVVLAFVVVIAAPAMEISLVIVAVWCLAALSPAPPQFASPLVLFGGAALGAVESLVLLRSGPTIWVLCAITLLAQPGWRRTLPMFIGCAVAAFAVAWFAAGQTLGNLPDYLSSGSQIVSGYSAALIAHSTSGLHLPAELLLGLTLIAAAILSSGRGRLRVAAAAVIGLACFSMFKEAAVRADPGHADIFFATAAGIGAAIAYGRRPLLTIAAVGGLSGVALAAPLPGAPVTFNPISHARDASDQVQALFNPTHRRHLRVIYTLGMLDHYSLSPAELNLLRGHTVEVDPWEAGLVWAYGLRWDPMPVFQDYSAYTPSLDKLNADRLRGPQAPERIVRQANSAIDGKWSGWEPPAAQIAMLCNYVPLQAPTQQWLILGKVADRCGAPQLIASIHTHFGQTVTIPSAQAGGLVYAKIHGAAVSGPERVGAVLYRAAFRRVVVNRAYTFRLVPGTAADGLLMNAAPGIDYPVPFNVRPGAHTIKLTGRSGALTIDVYWMPVRSAGPAASPAP